MAKSIRRSLDAILAGVAMLGAGCTTAYVPQDQLNHVPKDNIRAIRQMQSAPTSYALNTPSLSLEETTRIGNEYSHIVPKREMKIFYVTSENGKTNVEEYDLNTVNGLNAAAPIIKRLEGYIPENTDRDTMVFGTPDKRFVGSFSSTNQITNVPIEMVSTFTGNNTPSAAYVHVRRIDGTDVDFKVRTHFGVDKFTAEQTRYNGRLAAITAAESAGLGITLGPEAIPFPIIINGINFGVSYLEAKGTAPRDMDVYTSERTFGARPQVARTASLLGSAGNSLIIYKWDNNVGVISTNNPKKIEVNPVDNTVTYTRTDEDSNLFALAALAFLETGAAGAVYNAVQPVETNTIIRKQPSSGGGSSGSFGGQVPGGSAGGGSSGGFGGGP